MRRILANDFIEPTSFTRFPALVQAFGLVAVLGVFSAMGSARAQSPETLMKVSEAVSRMCSVPSERGSYFEVTGEGGLEAGSGLLLKFVGANITGTITKKDWEGVQDVLDKDRSTDRVSSRDCVLKLTPVFLSAFGASAASQTLLEKETNLQKDFASDNPAGRLVAFREAFKSIQVFFVELTSINEESARFVNSERIYQQNEMAYEQSLSKIIKSYNYETGQFRDDQNQDQYALSGQINQDSITFRNSQCSGHLRHQPETWVFAGPVTCKGGKYEGVFRLK